MTKPPAAGVIVVDGARILAFERLDKPGFALPCGSIEDGESPAQAALREAHEETGLVLALEPHAPFVGPDARGREVHMFLARVVGGELRGIVPGEGCATWAAIEQVLAGPYGDYNRRALEHFGMTVTY